MYLLINSEAQVSSRPAPPPPPRMLKARSSLCLRVPSLSLQQHLLVICGDRDREASSRSRAMARGDTEDYTCISILI